MRPWHDGVNALAAAIPLAAPAYLLMDLVGNPIPFVLGWFGGGSVRFTKDVPPPVESQLLAYVLVAMLGYVGTRKLVPKIKVYTLRRGISGKDLGKRGTSLADKDVPEALGIVPGAVFLICLTFCLVGYATTNPSKLLDCNSALLSICFMLFLGFSDDVLEWPWRYKLLLPTVASLPLLCCYDGSTSIVVPIPMRSWLMNEGSLTTFGWLLGHIVTVDQNANGAILNLGINGLEAGQSFIIGCAVLLHNLIEIRDNEAYRENHLFSIMIMLSFVGVTLGLLGHNWYPASVFVGDTYCYFAGMTFAVVGILGHFSKTLLLFFIPQVLNFLWSIPQLFKVVPCPKHRLPKFNPDTGLMQPSTFGCKSDQYRWLKLPGSKDATEIPNMTVINLCLQILGPMSERALCITLLGLQIVCCIFGLILRYHVAQFFFDD
eukprot:scaffold447983_cov67-Attheya_sp.AAC.1